MHHLDAQQLDCMILNYRAKDVSGAAAVLCTDRSRKHISGGRVANRALQLLTLCRKCC